MCTGVYATKLHIGFVLKLILNFHANIKLSVFYKAGTHTEELCILKKIVVDICGSTFELNHDHLCNNEGHKNS